MNQMSNIQPNSPNTPTSDLLGVVLGTFGEAESWPNLQASQPLLRFLAACNQFGAGEVELAHQTIQLGQRTFITDDDTSILTQLVTTDSTTSEYVELKHNIHNLVLNKLSGALLRFSEEDERTQRQSSERGPIIEFTALGLLTRLVNDTTVLAVPTPFRLDHTGPDYVHFDFLAAKEDEIGATLVKVQAKTTCIGKCGRFISRNTGRDGAEILSRYNTDIHILSGCCDLHLLQPGNVLSTSQAEMLVEEAASTPSGGRNVLDSLSQQLIKVIFEGRLWQGTRAINPAVG